ncbi:MAG: fuculose phosphate aldolase [Desulfobacterales bacterium]|nr:MAG: fuculose phosphate aldolase [Desulfobacterales bacterium]
MQLKREREKIVHYGNRMAAAGLTTGTGGNLSILNRRASLMAVTPSGLYYDELTPADIVVAGLNGRVVDGHRKPSSELAFHLAVYEIRPDVNAVVHTHSPWATTLACLGWELPAVHYLVGFSGHKVPLAPYAAFGTKELAGVVRDHLGDFNALLLANHGLITVGGNIDAAFAAAEEIEFVARVYGQAKAMGDPVILPEEEMSRVMEKFAVYGQKGGHAA